MYRALSNGWLVVDIIAVFNQSTVSKELISSKLNCLHSDIKFTHSITT